MRRLTIDTTCVIAAAQGEASGDEIDRLVDLARAGQVELWLTSAFAYDQSTARNGRAAANLMWLANRPLIRAVPGPFRFDLSTFNGPDVFASQEAADADQKITAILIEGPSEDAGRKIHDVHHLTAHLMAGHDAFITHDKGMLNKRDVLQSQTGIRIRRPSEALALAGAPVAPGQ
ncbi:hypothetical protein AB0I34_38010 [Kribbella sp. NPDC050281]|uniref:hypothetical protein n=1 Tax=Kribbella sp. NPDC050281 TaxID=3155515 RepID=UPI0033EB17AE